ncbi:uncharacterized protein [Dermacentor albipictus]|uniref:uncharacterized protein isoform X2 n=1 Tax=Dermacentor albipictus TaxID=60249 RepID=UPI0038FCB3B4
MEIALDFYTTSMWKGPGDVTRETLHRHHYRLRKVALERYTQTPKMGGEERASLHLQELKERIDTTFQVYREYLEEKNSTFVDRVASKVKLGLLTAGVGAAVATAAMVPMSIRAGLLAAMGVVSLTGPTNDGIVKQKLAELKKMERKNKASMAAKAAKGVKAYDDDSDNSDEEAPLVDTAPVLRKSAKGSY